MPDCFIFDHVRTPRGKIRGSSLQEATPISLASTVLAALRDRNRLDTALVDDVLLGCVEPTGEQGSNIARVAAIHANYAESVAGVQVHRFCASGLEACNLGAAQVMAGQAELVVGGGVESMSRVPMGASGGAWSIDPLVARHSYFVPQGISADLLATREGYDRKDVDAYAVESQRRAAEAWRAGHFARSIVPVRDRNGLTILDRDDYLRPETTLDSLGSLAPAFRKLGEDGGFDAIAIRRYPHIEAIDHVHHAGNSSGLVDGAAVVLLGNAALGARIGCKPRARIRSFASIGTEPTIMLTGPGPAARKALRQAGMEVDDIDLFEVNEAFAAVVMYFMDSLGVDHSRVNVNGGAIAMGHPLGATGAMLLGTAVDELERRGLGTALVTLCVGAGMGTATIIERV